MKCFSSWLKEGCFNTLATVIVILIGLAVAARSCGGPEVISGESRDVPSPDGAYIARVSETTYSNGGFGASTNVEVAIRDKMKPIEKEILALLTHDYRPRIDWENNTTLVIILDYVSSIDESHRDVGGVNIVYQLGPRLTPDIWKRDPAFARWVSNNVEGH